MLIHLMNLHTGCLNIQCLLKSSKTIDMNCGHFNNGWLFVYPEENLSPPKGLIPLKAVLQQNKSKMRPVLDFMN